MLHSIYGKLWAFVFVDTALCLLTLPLAGASTCPGYQDIVNQLGKSLSPGSSISNTTTSAPRWSLYGAPRPAFVVNVAAESDVATTVQYCNAKNIIFLVQSRGNGWADTFHLGSCGLLINIAGLNAISFNLNKTEATIQGGALVNDMVIAAYGNNTRFANPTCPCLGFLGAVLGGGIMRDMGLYGAGVDQIVSMNVVTASGQTLYVDETHNADLWYAVRGTAANFGIVTSAVVKAYPTLKARNVAWQGPLTFPEDKLEALIQAIYDLDLKPNMEIDFLFSTSGPPAYTPSITVIPLFLGNTSAAEEAFAPVLDVGPTSNGAKEIPYTQWGDFANSFCEKGERKPAYGASLAREGLNSTTWRTTYEAFKKFVAAYPEAGKTSILAEYYPVQKAVAIGNTTSSYPFRDVPIHVVAIPSYGSRSLDKAATAFGSHVRDLLRSTDGLARNSTYINFAHGDEPLETVYGNSLVRLQALKRKYDPKNRFNQWFPLVESTLA